MELIVFSKQDCPPCVTWMTVMDELMEDAEEYDLTLKIVKLELEPLVFERHRVVKTPTTIVVDKRSQTELGRVEGAQLGKLMQVLRSAKASRSLRITAYDDF